MSSHGFAAHKTSYLKGTGDSHPEVTRLRYKQLKPGVEINNVCSLTFTSSSTFTARRTIQSLLVYTNIRRANTQPRHQSHFSDITGTFLEKCTSFASSHQHKVTKWNYKNCRNFRPPCSALSTIANNGKYIKLPTAVLGRHHGLQDVEAQEDDNIVSPTNRPPLTTRDIFIPITVRN